VPQAARHEPDAENIPDGQADTIEQGLAAERYAALCEAFPHLSPRDQLLIALLIEDPPVPYAEISARLGIPVGSIGPNRRRCLDKPASVLPGERSPRRAFSLVPLSLSVMLLIGAAWLRR
jgi:DNA-directed RNA polymerase specialized sigma24 family protein